MIIDVNAYIGHWPFRKIEYDTAEKLLSLMDNKGIDIACVSNLNSIFYRDVMEGNIELIKQIKTHTDRFIPFGIINPAYPGWKKDFLDCVEILGTKCIELYPCYHMYKLSDPNAVELLNMAADRKIPVHLPCAIENIRQRHWLDVKTDLTKEELKEAAELCPKTDFIITNGPSSDIAAYLKSSTDKREGKVYYDFSRLGILNYGPDSFIEKVGINRVVFGTVMPLQYIETQFVKIYLSKLESNETDKILNENMKELLNI